jgi:hypothetical protein
MKLNLKPPGTKRLKLKYDVPLQTLLSISTCAATPGEVKWQLMVASCYRRIGRAVQVDPIKPMLQAPGTKRLKL